MPTTVAVPNFDSSRFMTIHEYAAEISATAEDIWESVVNGGSLHPKPWIMLSNGPKSVSENFVWNHAKHHGDLFFRRGDMAGGQERLATDAPAEAERTATAAELAKYTTRRAYAGLADPENRDERDDSHPVFAATGEPAFDKFQGPWHVEDWVRFGGPTIPVKLPGRSHTSIAQEGRRARYESHKNGKAQA